MLSRLLKRTSNLPHHHLRFGFSASNEVIDLPVIDISSFIGANSTPDLREAEKLVTGLRDLGALAIKDPRVDESKNLEFLEMMEKYFESRSEIFYGNRELKERFPQYGHQVGVTPELVERPRIHDETIEMFFKEDPPVTPQPPPKDGKWRYFWRIGEVDGKDELLLPPQAIPEDIPEWEEKMDTWGNFVRKNLFFGNILIFLKENFFHIFHLK